MNEDTFQKRTEETIERLTSELMDLKMSQYDQFNKNQLLDFELGELRKENNYIKKENQLLKNLIVGLSSHVGFKNNNVDELAKQIINENFK